MIERDRSNKEIGYDDFGMYEFNVQYKPKHNEISIIVDSQRGEVDIKVGEQSVLTFLTREIYREFAHSVEVANKMLGDL